MRGEENFLAGTVYKWDQGSFSLVLFFYQPEILSSLEKSLLDTDQSQCPAGKQPHSTVSDCRDGINDMMPSFIHTLLGIIFLNPAFRIEDVALMGTFNAA